MVPASREEYRRRFADLLRRRWDVSLWFVRPDYVPQDEADELRLLDHVEKRADLATYVEVRELKAWLLRQHSAASAG